MRRLTQEQLEIMGCYKDMTRDEMLAEIHKGLDLIEDADILELVNTLAVILEDCDDQEFGLWMRWALEVFVEDDSIDVA